MLTRTTHCTLALLAGALLAAGCGSSDNGGTTAPPPNGTTVDATPSLTFTPSTLTVSAGQAVTFAFGAVAHNVFFDTPGAPADIPGNNANVSVARTFPTGGSYSYTCHSHPSMHGTVVVH
jgi:plastocyanin